MSARDSIDPVRYITPEDLAHCRPVYVVWEITLACDLKCNHCGSRAGKPRPNELSTAECLDLVHQMARLGTREVTLIGGEAYLRKDWTTIIRAIRDAGMRCGLQTGGRNLTPARLSEALDAGLQGVGVSIDGLETLHDRLRGVPGSYRAAMAALALVNSAGCTASVNTQITALVQGELRELMLAIIDAGAAHWQVQFTVPMGNACDHANLIIQPYQLLEIMPLIASLFHEGKERGLLLQPGNNVGYFGPYEYFLRGEGDEAIHWNGCVAGQSVIGIEADGTIKGCPSLPTTKYSGGNIRDAKLEDIWLSADELQFARNSRLDELWGLCKTCYYGDVCLGGCNWTCETLMGRRGNNPYCHHRAIELQKQGLRERLARRRAAPGLPFDLGKFELIVEPINSPTVPIVSDPHELQGTSLLPILA